MEEIFKMWEKLCNVLADEAGNPPPPRRSRPSRSATNTVILEIIRKAQTKHHGPTTRTYKVKHRPLTPG
jgi:hypothetical protein